MKKNPLVYILGISAVSFFLFLIFSSIVLRNITKGDSTKKKLFTKSSNSIGVLEVKGTIMDSKKLVEQIKEFEEDPLIKGVVLRINSPGGAVGPSQEIYSQLKKLNATKPVYASMGSVAASGGYYIACGVRKIFANPGTITGSIGVIMSFADLSKVFQWAKVSPYVIKTGKFKDIGSPNREMSIEEKELLQGMVDNVLAQFRAAVGQARGMTEEHVKAVSDGRIFSGEQAKKEKLVDELGGFEDAVTALAKEVGISDKPKLVYPNKKHGFIFERLMGEGDDEDASSSNKLLIALAKLFLNSKTESSALDLNFGVRDHGLMMILPY